MSSGLEVSPGVEAVVITVSMLAVFGLTMTGLNLLAGHGLPALQVWVEERSPIVYGLTILIFCVALVSLGRIDVPRLMLVPDWLPALGALLAAPFVALAMYFLELFLSSRSVVRPAGMISTPSAHRATRQLTARPLVWWGLAITSAVGEELVFRGMLLSALLPGFGSVAAVAVSALIFGLHHVTFGAVSIASKTFGGVLLAGQTLWAASLVPAVVAHLLFQFLVWRRLRRTGTVA